MNTITTPDGEFVGPVDFAQAIGVVEKTVRRRLAKGAIDGAWQDGATGRWFIPVERIADALAEQSVPFDLEGNEVADPAPGTQVAVRPPRVVRMTETTAPVRAAHDVDLGFDVIPIDVVARAKGVTRGTVQRWGRIGKLDVGPYGVDGALAVWVER